MKNMQVQRAGRIYHTFYREMVLVRMRNGRRVLSCHDCAGQIGNRQLYYSAGGGARLCFQCVADFAPIEAWTSITLEDAQAAWPKKMLYQGRWVFELDGQFYLPMPNGSLDCFPSLESMPTPPCPSLSILQKELG